MTSPTLYRAAKTFLQNVIDTQDADTARAYHSDILGRAGFFSLTRLDARSHADILTESHAIKFAQALIDRPMPDGSKGVSANTFYRRIAGVKAFLEFCNAKDWSNVSASKLKFQLRALKLRPRDGTSTKLYYDLEPLIERVIIYVDAMIPLGNETEQLITLRNKAFVSLLESTGLRVGEVCEDRESPALKRGDLRGNKITLVGKGGKDAVVRVNKKALRYLHAYLEARAKVDGAQGIPLAALPLFARHDRGAGKKIKAMSVYTGEDIIHAVARAALGEDYDERLTAHKFRHYFGTRIHRRHGDLKKTQELMRHSSITTTAKIYTHVSEKELDAAYNDVFEEEG